MKNYNWKKITGAAFFAALLVGSGIARAGENMPMDPRTSMVCSCSRISFNDPQCQILKSQVFGTGGVNTSNPAHGAGAVMPNASQGTQPQAQANQ